jgi:hypothetical protein
MPHDGARAGGQIKRHGSPSGRIWRQICTAERLEASTVAEVFVEFADPVSSRDGVEYFARACGAENGHGHWEGWLEFVPLDGGEVLRSGRETTQPNRTDTEYWATGLTPVFLEGALARALNPIVRAERPPVPAPAHNGPAPNFVSTRPPGESILNPFSVYRKGEALLRSQLGAFSAWHLVNIIRAYELSQVDPAILTQTPPPVLVETIVTAVRARTETTAQ